MTQHLSYLSWIVLLFSSCAHHPVPEITQGNPEPEFSTPSVAPAAPVESPPVAAPRSSWTLVSQKATDLPHWATWLEVRVEGVGGTVDLSMVRFDSRYCTLRVIDQPESWSLGDKLGSSMRKVQAIGGVNGGYFHPDFTPLGLMIAGGRSLGQFTRSSLVSGMMRVRDGEPELVWNGESSGSSGASDLLQAGPRLVHDGLPVPGLDATKTAARTFIATDGGRGWVVGVARNVSLKGLAELLATSDLVPGLDVRRALNFDGGRSTAFYARTRDGREINEPGWSTVRNYVAVVPR